MSYANKTSVPVGKSVLEIESILRKYGADRFSYNWAEMEEKTIAIISFRMLDRLCKFMLPMPSRNDDRFCLTPRGKARSEEASMREWEQAQRQRWRALKIVIQAKLEAVECGITEFEEEFLAHIVLPDGKTTGEFMLPQIRLAYEAQEMPKMLP